MIQKPGFPKDREGESAESCDDHSVSEPRTERFESLRNDLKFEYSESFHLWNADRTRSIESLVMSDGERTVHDFLASFPHPPVRELARLIGEGIRREGNRCLDSPRDSMNGQAMFDELRGCSDIGSIQRLCVNFYTRATFLYRRVNKFMRETNNIDESTGRNLGIYIGILRECFCVQCKSRSRSGLNQLEWIRPAKLYRGATFPFEVVIDYGRRRTENIWWQGFTSASSDINVARQFQGNVMLEIFVSDPVPSLSQYSAFPNEHEFILSPYSRFKLHDVRWNEESGRWIIRVLGEPSTNPPSWFVATSDADS
jgi:hypothetical protein